MVVAAENETIDPVNGTDEGFTHLRLIDYSESLELDQAVLKETWDSHQSGRADHGERLLAVAVLVRWVEAWL